MADIRLKLSPPWIIYVNMVKALFGNDPEINIEYDNEIPEIRLLLIMLKRQMLLLNYFLFLNLLAT